MEARFTSRLISICRRGQSAEREEPKAEMDVAGLPVLVVDDNPTNLRILERTLLQWGMKPTLADSGAAALAAC